MNKTQSISKDKVRSTIQRLRDLSRGRELWRIRNKDDRSFVMQFEGWEEREAAKWWNERKDWDCYKNHELVQVRITSQEDEAMNDAADLIKAMYRELAK